MLKGNTPDFYPNVGASGVGDVEAAAEFMSTQGINSLDFVGVNFPLLFSVICDKIYYGHSIIAGKTFYNNSGQVVGGKHTCLYSTFCNSGNHIYEFSCYRNAIILRRWLTMKRSIFTAVLTVVLICGFMNFGVRAQEDNAGIFMEYNEDSDDYVRILSLIQEKRDVMKFAGIGEDIDINESILKESIYLVHRTENDIVLAYENNRSMSEVIVNDEQYLVPMSVNKKLYVLTIDKNGDALSLADIWETPVSMDKVNDTPFGMSKASIIETIQKEGIKEKDIVFSEFLYSDVDYIVMAYIKTAEKEYIIPYTFKSSENVLEAGHVYEAEQLINTLKAAREKETIKNGSNLYGGGIVHTESKEKSMKMPVLIGGAALLAVVMAGGILLIFKKKQ